MPNKLAEEIRALADASDRFARAAPCVMLRASAIATNN